MSGNFVVYLIGYIIVIIGVAYGMNAAGLGSQWIIPAVLVLVGLGIVYALSRSQTDKASERSAQTPQQTTQVQTPPANQSQAPPANQSQPPQSGTSARGNQ